MGKKRVRAAEAGVPDREARWAIYRSIPQKDWVEMSGRQPKILIEQSMRYGLPFGEAVVDLPDLARALHDFLAVHSRKLSKYTGESAEDDEAEQSSADNLELLRGEKYLRERLKRMAEEGSYIARADVHDVFAQLAAILRNAGDILQRQHSREAHQVLDEALTECVRLVEARL